MTLVNDYVQYNSVIKRLYFKYSHKNLAYEATDMLNLLIQFTTQHVYISKHNGVVHRYVAVTCQLKVTKFTHEKRRKLK